MTGDYLDRGTVLKAEKLLQMVYLLLANQQLSAPVLAEKLGVTVRTIYRYVDTLSTAGVPVYALKGRNGGIALLPQFKLNSTMVNQEEQANILAALQSLRVLEATDDETVDKLAGIFQQSPVEWFKIDPTAWQMNKSQKASVSRLRTAILQHQFVRFNYLNANNDYQARAVYPYQVIFKDHAWYLEGYSIERAAVRLFKLVRMDQLQLRPAPTDLPGKPWLTAKKQAPTMPKTISVTLQVQPTLKYRVLEEFQSAEVTLQADGQYLVQTQFSENDWLITYLLSFGPALTVLAPASIRDRVKAALVATLKNY